jgi:TolA-binding protein
MLRRLCGWAALATILTLLAGCGGDNAELQKRLETLETQNEELRERIDTLTDELRPLEKKIHEIDESNRHLEKAIVQASKDLQSRIHEMVQQERSGRRHFRPAPKVVAKPVPEDPKPYMGFDGQTVTEELARELELKTQSGVLVTAVREGAPASVAGLKKDDVIQTFDGAGIKTKTELIAALAKKEPGDIIALTGIRGAGKFGLKIKLGRR